MKRITDYKIIEAATAGGIEQAVKGCLVDGWQPHGNPGQTTWLSTEGIKEAWWQAMVKTTDK